MEPKNAVWKWIISFRVYSLAFILMPFILGILIAVRNDGHEFKPFLTLLGFIPLVLCHLAANLQSDIIDYEKGVDVVPHMLSGGIVRKWISIEKARKIVIVFYSVALTIGISMIPSLGPVMILFTLLGLGLGIFYSAGDNFAVKYNVTGEWFIFIGFGIVIPAYAYFLNAGHVSISPILLAIPAAFLMAAVKHANNWIAALTPGSLEKKTTAYLAGHKLSRYYYYTMIAIPYLLILALMMWGNILSFKVPGSLMIIFFTLPVFIILIARGRKENLVNHEIRTYGLDSMTALHYTLFTALCCFSVLAG